ncbi:hypothetical protein SteCoe_1047 [Stentor coeruleus]|uniref:Uncharacterized protein n=1 Tax=Stentor coeruleus TaxID=5963 RepID=A0A1R2D330_9CILI|nr:hypothetical protein SteCoe_1047 [Stentor coeruleus]
MILWFFMIYFYKKKGVDYFKKQEISENIKEMSQDYMTGNAKANEDHSQAFNAKENCDDDDAIIRDNYDEKPNINQNEKEFK